jgi:hypothetical protein
VGDKHIIANYKIIMQKTIKTKNNSFLLLKTKLFNIKYNYDYHADINGVLGIYLKSLDCQEKRKTLCSVVVQSGLFNRPTTLAYSTSFMWWKLNSNRL